MAYLLPLEGYVRLRQILGDPEADPPIPAIIPVSKSTWFAGQKTGRFPKPIKLGGGRIAVYRNADIRALCESSPMCEGGEAQS